MKKLLLILLLSTCVYSVQAQINTNVESTTTTKSVARTPDTTTATIPKHVKTRIIGGAQMRSDKDIVDNIKKSKDHTTLTNAILAGNLSETLKSRGPLTIFAPTNDAFNQLAPGTLDTLLKTTHGIDLTRLLTYHVISGKYTSKDIAKQIVQGKGSATFITLTGAKLIAKINGDRNIVLVDENGKEAVISQFDIEQSNGIIDVVTAVLVPKSKL
ncbi:MAG: fasciclin domain-containing protein [Mucilaginibacter sp.]|uniref:fasciclin domain-containing protein n=1 Tax=Mucilaginibacter sp. TaxID=1882438 RepID=UPI00326365AC